jgi:hypothetical protein
MSFNPFLLVEWSASRAGEIALTTQEAGLTGLLCFKGLGLWLLPVSSLPKRHPEPVALGRVGRRQGYLVFLGGTRGGCRVGLDRDVKMRSMSASPPDGITIAFRRPYGPLASVTRPSGRRCSPRFRRQTLAKPEFL